MSTIRIITTNNEAMSRAASMRNSFPDHDILEHVAAPRLNPASLREEADVNVFVGFNGSDTASYELNAFRQILGVLQNKQKTLVFWPLSHDGYRTALAELIMQVPEENFLPPGIEGEPMRERVRAILAAA